MNDVTYARAKTHEEAHRLSSLLNRSAKALEKSAELADVHARRSARQGRTSEAANEWRAAERARDAAELARFRATEAANWETPDGPARQD